MNVAKELASLNALGMNDLRAVYARVFGESTRVGNRTFLVRRILWRMQSQEEGTLSERARQRAEAIADEAYLRTTIPKLHAALGRQVVVHAPMHKGGPTAGTVITRQYKGRTLSVTVLADGYEYEGQRYGSLSAVAKAVTGSHWNGNLFFGLTNKKEARHDAA